MTAFNQRIVKKYLFSILASFLFLSACETEVDLFTDFEKIPVVFALLEPANEVQYFRINPTFIGDGDARDVAGNPDITNYAAGEIEVKLIDVTNSDNEIEYILKDSMGLIDLDDDGIFDTKNRIYYLETPVTTLSNGQIVNEVLKPLNEYRLIIKNVATGKEAKSEIALGDINKLQMAVPRVGTSQFPRDWMVFYSGTQYNEAYTFEFDADKFSERFLLEMRFYYTEGAEDKNSKARSELITIGERNDIDAFSETKRVTIDLDGERFYSILQGRLDASTSRTGQTFDLIITAAGPDLETYISVQNASLSGLSQERPSYSNIEGGIGIFSYRLNRTFPEFKLNDNSAKHLFNGPYTFDLFNCCRHGTQSNSEGVIPCR